MGKEKRGRKPERTTTGRAEKGGNRKHVLLIEGQTRVPW